MQRFVRKIKSMKRIIIIIAAVAMLAGCKTHERIVTVYQHHTDTLIQTKMQRDSIYSHDSIYIKEKGDTVWIEKWHTRWRERLLTDTLYISKVDSVPKPYPVHEYIEKPLTWWQKTRIYAGNILLIGLFVAAGFGTFKLLKKFKVI